MSNAPFVAMDPRVWARARTTIEGKWDRSLVLCDLRWAQDQAMRGFIDWPGARGFAEVWGWSKSAVSRLLAKPEAYTDPTRLDGWSTWYAENVGGGTRPASSGTAAGQERDSSGTDPGRQRDTRAPSNVRNRARPGQERDRSGTRAGHERDGPGDTRVGSHSPQSTSTEIPPNPPQGGAGEVDPVHEVWSSYRAQQAAVGLGSWGEQPPKKLRRKLEQLLTHAELADVLLTVDYVHQAPAGAMTANGWKDSRAAEVRGKEATPGWLFGAEPFRRTLHHAQRWDANGRIPDLDLERRRRQARGGPTTEDAWDDMLASEGWRTLLQYCVELPDMPLEMIERSLSSLDLTTDLDAEEGARRRRALEVVGIGEVRLGMQHAVHDGEDHPTWLSTASKWRRAYEDHPQARRAP